MIIPQQLSDLISRLIRPSCLPHWPRNSLCSRIRNIDVAWMGEQGVELLWGGLHSIENKQLLVLKDVEVSD